MPAPELEGRITLSRPRVRRVSVPILGADGKPTDIMLSTTDGLNKLHVISYERVKRDQSGVIVTRQQLERSAALPPSPRNIPITDKRRLEYAVVEQEGAGRFGKAEKIITSPVVIEGGEKTHGTSTAFSLETIRTGFRKHTVNLMETNGETTTKVGDIYLGGRRLTGKSAVREAARHLVSTEDGLRFDHQIGLPELEIPSS